MHSDTHEVTLGLAFVLGALRAAEPGHGKTAILDYLSGGRRSVWHTIVIGISSGIAYSVSLIAGAMALHPRRLDSHDRLLLYYSTACQLSRSPFPERIYSCVWSGSSSIEGT